MTMFSVRIKQSYLTERVIVVSVEAEDGEDALEQVTSGLIDTPNFEDPRWLTGWDLLDEEAELNDSATPIEGGRNDNA